MKPSAKRILNICTRAASLHLAPSLLGVCISVRELVDLVLSYAYPFDERRFEHALFCQSEQYRIPHRVDRTEIARDILTLLGEHQSAAIRAYMGEVERRLIVYFLDTFWYPRSGNCFRPNCFSRCQCHDPLYIDEIYDSIGELRRNRKRKRELVR